MSDSPDDWLAESGRKKATVIGRMKYIKAGHFEGHIRISEQADLKCDGV